MRVSVILPTRNRRELLAAALASALARIGSEDEIVVVDDGSTDGTAEDFRSPPPRVRFLPANGRGASAARNTGIAATSGEYLAFLDSDDEWLPGGLDEQIAALAADEGLGLSHARAAPIDANGRRHPVPIHGRLEGDVVRSLLSRNPVTTSTVVVPRRVLREVGVFDEALARSMDRDLWTRIAERYRFHDLDRIVCRYRFHERQQIRNRRGMDEARCRIYEKAIERYGDARPELRRTAERLLARRRLRLARLCRREGDAAAATGHLRAAVRLRPLAARFLALGYRL